MIKSLQKVVSTKVFSFKTHRARAYPNQNQSNSRSSYSKVLSLTMSVTTAGLLLYDNKSSLYAYNATQDNSSNDIDKDKKADTKKDNLNPDYSDIMKSIVFNLSSEISAQINNISNVKGNDVPNVTDVEKSFHMYFNSALPGQLGFGFLMGYCSGYSLKKASRVGAFVIGSMFIVIQSLSYGGYAQINMEKLSNDIDRMLDLNKDGKADEKDAQYAWDKVYPILSYQMPTGGSFAIGLYRGLRS